MRSDEIVIDPEISAIFKINDKILEEIYQKMLLWGFDESQPLVLQKGTNILLDGHTRLAAARKAGFTEVPVVLREFESREEAAMYTFERQALRRNLTGAEILTAAQMIPERKERDGKGRAAEQLAKRINVGAATIYQAKAILKDGPEELIQAVKNGDMSIKKAYGKIAAAKKKTGPEPDAGIAETDPYCLPPNVRFLKGAVILLVEKHEKPAASLLISHFLKKNERPGFSKLLPDAVRTSLENTSATQV
jgi:hypothetical protein